MSLLPDTKLSGPLPWCSGRTSERGSPSSSWIARSSARAGVSNGTEAEAASPVSPSVVQLPIAPTDPSSSSSSSSDSFLRLVAAPVPLDGHEDSAGGLDRTALLPLWSCRGGRGGGSPGPSGRCSSSRSRRRSRRPWPAGLRRQS